MRTGARAARALALIVLAISLAGCFAGVPNVRGDAGLGTVTMPHGTNNRTDGMGSLRAGWFPAQLFDSASGRSFDVGGGYGYDAGEGFELHTAYAEVDMNRKLGSARKSPVMSFGVAPRLVWDGIHDKSGGGAALRVSIDLTSDFIHEYSTHSGEGAYSAFGAHGQMSFGFYAEGSFVSMGPWAFATATAGVTCRLPAMGFVVF